MGEVEEETAGEEGMGEETQHPIIYSQPQPQIIQEYVNLRRDSLELGSAKSCLVEVAGVLLQLLQSPEVSRVLGLDENPPKKRTTYYE